MSLNNWISIEKEDTERAIRWCMNMMGNQIDDTNHLQWEFRDLQLAGSYFHIYNETYETIFVLKFQK